MQSLSYIVLVIFCVLRCGSSSQLRVPLKYLAPCLLISQECRDMQWYPKTKQVGGTCFDESTSKYGILRAQSQCCYNVSGKTPSIIGYSCCDPIVCCPNLDLTINIHDEYCQAIQDFVYDDQIKLYRESLMPVRLNPSVCDEPQNTTDNELIAKPFEFPFMVGLGYTNVNGKFEWDGNTGGILISDQFILTAAHSLKIFSRPVTLARLGDLSDLGDCDDFGDLIRSKDIQNNTIHVNIIERIFHPQYNNNQFYHNIALLKLERRLEFSTSIRPACLPSRSDFPDSTILVGWSQTRFDHLTKFRNITILTMDTCKDTFEHVSKLRNGINIETQICVKTNKNRNCLSAVINYHDRIHGAFEVIGIVPVGSICGATTLYTRVAPYVNWIESIIWN